MKGKRVSEPNWTGSKTGDCEIWKNPLIPMNDRLEIADGAIRFRDEQLDRLRAENAAQALLIASLKEDCEAGKRLLREQMALTTARTGEDLFVAQQLSDTQRQNAELMENIIEVLKIARAHIVELCQTYGNPEPEYSLSRIDSIIK